MAGVTSGDIECPVCHDDFTNPKLLPCNHLACRDCVLSWLQKEGGQGGCPLCRAPILSSTQQGQGQLATMVDSLPTDFATAALVESHKVLNGPHVCDVCENNVTATSYCFDCSIKLCKACTSHHQKFPVLKDHTLEQLNKLTAKRLAASRQGTCNNHSNRPAEVYCSTHQKLMCMLCATTHHCRCLEVKAITDVAREKRTELTQQSQRLKEIAAGLTKQMKAAKETFKGMHNKVNNVFDDLQQCSEKRRQQVHDLIQKEEDATVTSLAEMEKARAAMTSNSSNIDHLVTSAPDDALLQMLNQLKSRLDDLESESGKTAKVKDVGDIVFYSQLLTRLKSDLSKLGEIQKPQQQASASPSATATTTTPSS
ncbi:transcription intermediary factor 1-beta-like, partial [Littorina saxatilis]